MPKFEVSLSKLLNSHINKNIPEVYNDIMSSYKDKKHRYDELNEVFPYDEDTPK